MTLDIVYSEIVSTVTIIKGKNMPTINQLIKRERQKQVDKTKPTPAKKKYAGIPKIQKPMVFTVPINKVPINKSKISRTWSRKINTKKHIALTSTKVSKLFCQSIPMRS